MNRLDFATIAAALNPESLVPQWLPGGQRRGKEWVTANPMRADNNAGSFSVNLLNGQWTDFAASGVSGSDLISLYAYLYHNDDQGAAARELAKGQGVIVNAQTRAETAAKVTKIEAAKPKLLMPVPASAKAVSFAHKEYGQPSKTWCYKNRDGAVLLYVCRFDMADGGRKQIIPRSFVRAPDGSEFWSWRGITGEGQRPLYGLDRLALNRDADVVIVEGEKAADAAQAFFGDDAVVVTWLGGVPTADKISLASLENRTVYLWPDFDCAADKQTGEILPLHEQPGMEAMAKIATALKPIASRVQMVGYTPGAQEHGWDLADAAADGWTKERVMAYLANNAGDPLHIAAQKAPAVETVDAPAPVEYVPIHLGVNGFGFPDRGEKGQPLNTIQNLEYLLGEYGVSTRYNAMRKAVEIEVPGCTYTIDNRDNNSLTELLSMCARNRMPQSNVADYVRVLADRQAYNPVKDWIQSVPWDGITRLQDIFGTVKASMDDALKNRLMYRWMLSAVAALYAPDGFTAHGVLVFTGKQSVGKTSWIKSLVPRELNAVLEGAILDPADKDSVVNAVSHWIVELGELDATFRKSDIARLKGWVTLPTDKMRLPYDRVQSQYRRSTVCFASVNESAYLVDDTGNRRWWTIPVSEINFQHELDVQQIWAELLVLMLRGEQWWLTRDEESALNKLNEDHAQVDPIEEQIMSGFDWDDTFSVTEMTATQVLLAIGYDKPQNAAVAKASKVLKRLTNGDPKKTGRGRFFKIPRRIKHTGDGGPF